MSSLVAAFFMILVLVQLLIIEGPVLVGSEGR